MFTELQWVSEYMGQGAFATPSALRFVLTFVVLPNQVWLVLGSILGVA